MCMYMRAQVCVHVCVCGGAHMHTHVTTSMCAHVLFIILLICMCHHFIALYSIIWFLCLTLLHYSIIFITTVKRNL